MNDSTNKANTKFLHFSDDELIELLNGLDEAYSKGFAINVPRNSLLSKEIEKTLNQRGVRT